VDTTDSPVLGLLRARKVLPRRNLQSDDSTTRLGRKRSPPRKSLPTAYTTSERIESWIPESSSISVVPIVGKTMIPPINSRDNFKSWIDDAALRHRKFGSLSNGSLGDTPLVQQRPPTLERTPPKKLQKAPSSTAPPSSRNVSSSRLDSFKTARENLSSDEENEDAGSPNQNPARQKWLHFTGLEHQREIGLGLGLESVDDGPTPKRTTPVSSPKHNEFVSFDGVWGGDTPRRIGRDLDAAAAKENIVKDSRKRTPPRTVVKQEPPKLQVDVGPFLTNSLSLRKRVEQRRRSPETASMKDFAEQINWPLKASVHVANSGTHDSNDKRLSQASTASTVVTAMVIDSPPRRRQTLRRTDKVFDLHATPSIRRKGAMASDNSKDRSLRRRSRASNDADEALRRSFVLDTHATASPNDNKAARDQNSSLIIPDRRSSLQSSTASSKHVSRTFSLNSHQQSSRPTTAPEDTVSYFDIPRRDRRAVSVVIQQATPVNSENREKVTSPQVNNTISPPSMPPSTLVSRTTSETSGGMITHCSPSTPMEISSPQDVNAEEVQDVALNQTTAGDWSVFRPRSAQVTPFSLRSAQSSTPGTLEVNEATAISIYPHTNKSILVIQETAGRASSQTRQQNAIVATNASIAIPGTISPTINQEVPPSRDLTASPLKNPRDPPQPPEFIKIIPPTPANAPPSSEDTRIVPDTPTRANRFSAPFSFIKRAFSARRHSDSVASPFTRTLSLRGPVRRRFSMADDPDSKLHPFWRPRSYEGDSDSESEFGNNGILSPQRSNSLQIPRMKRQFTGSMRDASSRFPRRASSTSAAGQPHRHALPYKVNHGELQKPVPLARRLTGSVRLPASRRYRQAPTAEWSNPPNYELVKPVDGDGGYQKPNGTYRHGHAGQLAGFRGFAQRLERRWEMRGEREREKSRDRLKGRIVQDVKG